MVKHNNVIPNGHFHKDWQRYVKTWFGQPAQKKARREARVAKAKQMAPRPLNKLRSAVRCPTIKYNRKVRTGRGFTMAELKVYTSNTR
jgi:large subunit ribosomal protein L13e